MANRRYRDEDWLYKQYIIKDRSTVEIAELCDVDDSTIWRWIEEEHEIGVKEHDPNERTEAAREALKEEHGDGLHLAQWVEENPEKHQEVAQEAAKKGAPNRETNGMAGKTGQQNPNWRGGKTVYKAVRSQLHGPSWETVKALYKTDSCYSCRSEEDLHLHHIVPIMSGGTNDAWNLMTLCRTCHTKVEHFTRNIVDLHLED